MFSFCRTSVSHCFMAMRRLPPSRSPMFRSPVLTMTRQNGAGGAGWNGKCARARSLAPQRGWSLRWVWGKVCGSGSCTDRRSNPNAVRRRCYGASYHHLNSKGTHRSDTRRCGATRVDCGTLPASSPTLPWFPPLYLRPPPLPCLHLFPPFHHDNWRTYAYPLSNIHDAPSSSLVQRKPFI